MTGRLTVLEALVVAEILCQATAPDFEIGIDAIGERLQFDGGSDPRLELVGGVGLQLELVLEVDLRHRVGTGEIRAAAATRHSGNSLAPASRGRREKTR